jgi:uncharacterized protein YecE (DUF72 family)
MSKQPAPRIRVGIGGWVFEPWRGSFYPDGLSQKRELEYASRKLTTIEVNGTYYGSQKPETFRKWRDETPEDFVFALKGPRFATNRRILSEAGESVERFFKSGVMELQDKLGPVNWQLMASKRFDPDDIAGFFALLPKAIDGRAIRHALEVRHASFRTPEFVALARAHGVAVILAGDSDFPQIADPTAPFVYARIMGTVAEAAAGYPEPALDAWAERARSLAAGSAPAGLETVAEGADGVGRDVFLYVISGAKERNPAAAMALIERLG